MKPDNFTDVSIVWELRGSYPQDIPYFSDIDLAELTQGDENPFFLTIPIGEANVKSGNGRYYDEAWLQELERQVATNRPIGIMGHLKDPGADFPPEAIHWLGVKRIGEILWGKGYVPPGEARERIRRYKATNKQIATSIYAKARGVYDKAVDALRMAADSMQLHQIDIGPVDRVGIPSMATVPIVTAEMQNDSKETVQMDKLELIRELTAEDADVLPKPVREAVLASVPTPPEVALVTELRGELGEGDMLALVRELKREKEERQKTAVTHRITELVSAEEGGIRLAELRPVVTELVKARQPQTVEEAEAAYKEVAASEMVMEMLKTTVASKGGPPLRTGLQGQQGGNKYFNIPRKEGDKWLQR